jgi:hypothetical protein
MLWALKSEAVAGLPVSIQVESRIIFARLLQLFRAVSTPEPKSRRKAFRLLFALVEPTNKLPIPPFIVASNRQHTA